MAPKTRRLFLLNATTLAAALASSGPSLGSCFDTIPSKPTCSPADQQDQSPAFGQGVMVGEVTDTTSIVQARVTKGTKLVDGQIYDDRDALKDGDLPGVEANVLFVLTEIRDGRQGKPIAGKVASAIAERDFIARVEFEDLKPNTRYQVKAYIVSEGRDSDEMDLTQNEGPRASFRTHPGKGTSAAVRFAMTSCMNYDNFMGSDLSNNKTGHLSEDRQMGYPTAATLAEMKPDFAIFAGDVVYYDKKPKVKTLTDMSAKWHRQYNLPRMIEMCRVVPGYYMKDDHDYRSDDADGEGNVFPSADLGIKTFREQCPIVKQGDDASPTYRTHRVSKDLQIWMVEGRDYRSANRFGDGPDKTIWGREQTAWLKKTLLESDATYRILISPTPLVGPDDLRKRDNHTNQEGFRTEGDAFKQWGKANGLWSNTFLMCGDRHWQYHSVDPSGAQEFSCGAFNDENSRLGRKPGDPASTDPDALVTQLFTSPKRTGGFIIVTIDPGDENAKATVRFDYHDDHGKLLYTYSPSGNGG